MQVQVLKAGLLAGVLIGLGSGRALAWCESETMPAAAIARSISEQWPLRPRNDPLNERINRIGKTLTRQPGRLPQRGAWQFRIVRNLQPYAYAVGNGLVYLTDGSASFARNESELAAILAHEMGHQLAGHFCKGQRIPGAERAPFWFGNKAKAVDTGKPLGGAVLVVDLEKEREADAIALELLQSSGYDPRAMLEVAKRLPNLGGPDQRRIAALEARLAGILDPHRK